MRLSLYNNYFSIILEKKSRTRRNCGQREHSLCYAGKYLYKSCLGKTRSKLFSIGHAKKIAAMKTVRSRFALMFYDPTFSSIRCARVFSVAFQMSSKKLRNTHRSNVSSILLTIFFTISLKWS